MRAPCKPALVALAMASALARAADDDALDLKSAEPATAAVAEAPVGPRWMLELAALHAQSRFGHGSDSGHRTAVDLRWTGRLADQWRFGLSNRIDDIQLVLQGQPKTRHHLREAYVGWQSEDGQRSVDVGRINQRHGPAYGYNPTDIFRRGATRSVVTADPIALRENRTGTFMLRISQLWNGGGASLTWAPQLTRGTRDTGTFSLDLDGTNASDRVVLTANARVSDRLSGEAVWVAEEGRSPRLGANVTGLVTDAAVMHAEWSMARTAKLVDVALGGAEARAHRHQATLGVTYSLSRGPAITVEAAYNGAGLNRSDWQRVLAQGSAPALALFNATQSDQELAARRVWMVYVTQRSAFLKELDLTAYVRQNTDDRSNVAWAELRYRFPSIDIALQWQRATGRAGTEANALPIMKTVQLIGRILL